MKPVFALLFPAALLALTASAQVKITPGAEKVSVEIDGKPFTDFYVAGTAFGAEVTKPYLWPLRAPSGTYITRAWPMENVAEEEKILKDRSISGVSGLPTTASTSWTSGTTRLLTKRRVAARSL